MSNRLQFTNHLGVARFIERSRSASPRAAKNLFDEMPWKLASALRVTNPEGVRLEISGSATEGFRMVHGSGSAWFAATGTPSREQCRATLDLFARGDSRWQAQRSWERASAPPDGTGADADGNSGGCLAALLVLLVLLVLV